MKENVRHSEYKGLHVGWKNLKLLLVNKWAWRSLKEMRHRVMNMSRWTQDVRNLILATREPTFQSIIKNNCVCAVLMRINWRACVWWQSAQVFCLDFLNFFFLQTHLDPQLYSTFCTVFQVARGWASQSLQSRSVGQTETRCVTNSGSMMMTMMMMIFASFYSQFSEL